MEISIYCPGGCGLPSLEVSMAGLDGALLTLPSRCTAAKLLWVIPELGHCERMCFLIIQTNLVVPVF